MRNLKQFIAESVHTYDYTIKVAGDVDKNFLELFKFNLDKFSPVEIKGPKSTPIQANPYGFPNLNNEPVHIFTCKFAYPCTEPMVQQMAQLLGHNINYVRMVNTAYNDGINDEMDQYENQDRSEGRALSDFSFKIGKIVTASNINKAGWGLIMSLVESSIRTINLEFT